MYSLALHFLYCLIFFGAGFGLGRVKDVNKLAKIDALLKEVEASVIVTDLTKFAAKVRSVL